MNNSIPIPEELPYEEWFRRAKKEKDMYICLSKYTFIAKVLKERVTALLAEKELLDKEKKNQIHEVLVLLRKIQASMQAKIEKQLKVGLAEECEEKHMECERITQQTINAVELVLSQPQTKVLAMPIEQELFVEGGAVSKRTKIFFEMERISERVVEYLKGADLESGGQVHLEKDLERLRMLKKMMIHQLEHLKKVENHEYVRVKKEFLKQVLYFETELQHLLYYVEGGVIYDMSYKAKHLLTFLEVEEGKYQCPFSHIHGGEGEFNVHHIMKRSHLFKSNPENLIPLHKDTHALLHRMTDQSGLESDIANSHFLLQIYFGKLHTIAEYTLPETEMRDTKNLQPEQALRLQIGLYDQFMTLDRILRRPDSGEVRRILEPVLPLLKELEKFATREAEDHYKRQHKKHAVKEWSQTQCVEWAEEAIFHNKFSHIPNKSSDIYTIVKQLHYMTKRLKGSKNTDEGEVSLETKVLFLRHVLFSVQRMLYWVHKSHFIPKKHKEDLEKNIKQSLKELDEKYTEVQQELQNTAHPGLIRSELLRLRKKQDLYITYFVDQLFVKNADVWEAVSKSEDMKHALKKSPRSPEEIFAAYQDHILSKDIPETLVHNILQNNSLRASENQDTKRVFSMRRISPTS